MLLQTHLTSGSVSPKAARPAEGAVGFCDSGQEACPLGTEWFLGPRPRRQSQVRVKQGCQGPGHTLSHSQPDAEDVGQPALRSGPKAQALPPPAPSGQNWLCLNAEGSGGPRLGLLPSLHGQDLWPCLLRGGWIWGWRWACTASSCASAGHRPRHGFLPAHPGVQRAARESALCPGCVPPPIRCF